MAVSKQLADMVRDASIGMKDADVLERTGIGFATWRRTLQGQVPSDDTLLKIAAGLNIDVQPLLDVAASVRGSRSSHDQLMIGVLEISPLDSDQRRQIMQLYRELLRSNQNSNAA